MNKCQRKCYPEPIIKVHKYTSIKSGCPWIAAYRILCVDCGMSGDECNTLEKAYDSYISISTQEVPE